MPKLQIRRPDGFTLAIAAVALFGAALVLYRQSAYGVSVSADSGVYISMARNALAGHGLMSYDGGYPGDWLPLTALLYAVFSFGVFDPMAVAGPLNAAMLAVSVFTVGVWLRRRAESRFVAIWACAAAVVSLPVIRMFDFALSEPSFILSTTLALYWADRHLEDGKRSSLAWAAAFSAAACFSRFLGVAAVAVIAGMFLLRRGVSWRERFISVSAYSAVSFAPMGAWIARNWLNSGSAVEQQVFRDSLWSYVAPMLESVSKWQIPLVANAGEEGATVWAPSVALALAAGLTLFALYRWLRTGGGAWSFVPLTAGFALAYLAALLYGLTTGASDLERYVMFAYFPLLLAAAFALDRALAWNPNIRFGGLGRPRRTRSARRGRRARGSARRRAQTTKRYDGRLASAIRSVSISRNRIPAVALMAALAIWTAYGGYVAVLDASARASEHGEGRINREFYESETIQFLMGLRGADIGVVYSKEPLQAYWALDGRGIYPIPPYDWRDMESELESRRDAADETIIAWFHDGLEMRYGASAFRYSPGFEPLGSFRDGDVFRLKRGHQPADPRAGTPLLEDYYDVYLDGGALTWVRQPCSDEDALGRVELWAAPVNPDDPPEDDRDGFGGVSMNFPFHRFGVKLGDLCVVRRPLPDYPLREIRTGQGEIGGEWLYRVWVPLPVSDEALAYYRTKYESVSAGGGESLFAGEYDVYLDGGALVYLKEPCAESDTRGRFRLGVFPVNPSDLPAEQREAGYVALNFDFQQYGVRFDGKCMIRRPLPDFDVSAVGIGRWIPGESVVWTADVRMP